MERFLRTLKRLPFIVSWARALHLLSIYHFLLAFCGAVRFWFPSKKLFVIGITGTKGKTTSLELLNAILESAGKRTALLSSIAIKIHNEREKNLTDTSMPGRFFIQRFLSRAVRSGCTHALLEVTSEGVTQHRHRFITWRIGALTNLAKEHIEAHGSFEKYKAAKLAFFRYVADLRGTLFIRKEDPYQYDFQRSASGGVLRFYSLRDLDDLEKTCVSGDFFQGNFNKENAALAFLIARELGVSDAVIEKTFAAFRGVPGRMEYVQKKPCAVIIDYAHTPDSLEVVYQTIKPPRPHRLICVLGSAGGGRDTWKRKVMGEIADRYCEDIILTDEDSYNEDLRHILRDVAEGISKKEKIQKILNRKEAIAHAVSRAKNGDVVIITGKGSELWMHHSQGKRILWNEREVVESVLNNKKNEVNHH